MLRHKLPSLTCCFCNRLFSAAPQLQLHLTHAHPHLRFTFENGGSSSHPVTVATITRPPLSQDEPMLFSWFRHAPADKADSRGKRKRKAAAACDLKLGTARQYFHSVSWLPMTLQVRP